MRRFLVVFALWIAAANMALAAAWPDECIHPITGGQPVEAILENNPNCTVAGKGNEFADIYTFVGTAGQQVTISMSAEFRGPCLILDDQNYDVFDTTALAWDCRPNDNYANIIGFTLPSTGAYYLWVTTWGRATTGRYSLTLFGAVGPPKPDLNQHGLTGSWYEPATSGQGVELEVYPDLTAPGTGLAFMSWFTFDSVVGGADRQRWYTADGPVVTGQSNATLTIYRNSGGNFNAPPITESQVVGTATLGFDSCTTGTLSYTFTDGTGRTGSIPLSRLTQSMTCSITGARPTNADFAFSGNWYDPATSGQGITVEVNTGSQVLFLAWYTYAPNGAGAGAAGQRWYTAEQTTPLIPGSRTIPLRFFETTGGAFDTPTSPAPSTVVVGSGTLAFQNCSSATLSYNFTGGSSSSGASGSIALKRVGPVPAGCAM